MSDWSSAPRASDAVSVDAVGCWYLLVRLLQLGSASPPSLALETDPPQPTRSPAVWAAVRLLSQHVRSQALPACSEDLLVPALWAL